MSVGAIENRDVSGAVAVLIDELVDLLTDERSFVVFIVAHVSDDRLSRALLGPQSFLAPRGVVGYHRVGRAQDVLGGAVVLFEQDGRGVREVTLEFLDIANRGATEGVDRLIRVTHHAQTGRRQ